MVELLVGLVIVIGIIGTVVPLLPGAGLVWLAIVGYAIVEGLGAVGWVALSLATALLVASIYLGVRIPQRAAAGQGLSMRGQLVGLLLAIVGFFAIPIVGAPLGFVLGVFLVRRSATGDNAAAWASTRVTIISLVKASLAQTAAATLMGLVWLAWVTLG